MNDDVTTRTPGDPDYRVFRDAPVGLGRDPRPYPCDKCEKGAAYTVTATYPATGTNHAHPLWHTYPAPMARVCEDHLTPYLHDDQHGPAGWSGTGAWIIRAVSS